MNVAYSLDINKISVEHPNVAIIFLQFKPQLELCRASQGNCDVPEYCTGVSGEVCIV